MKSVSKVFAILICLSLLLFAEEMTRYVHSTGKVSLRIDDVTPGGFVEHDLSGIDYLWVSFIAVSFNEFDSTILHGRASDDSGGELFRSNFERFSEISLSEDIDTSFDTTFYLDTIRCYTDTNPSLMTHYYVPPDTIPDSSLVRLDTTLIDSVTFDTTFVYTDTTPTLMPHYYVLPDSFPPDSSFMRLDSLHFVTTDTVLRVDTIYTFLGAQTGYSYGNDSLGLRITQNIGTRYYASGDSAKDYIPVAFCLENTSDQALTGGKFMFFYDADVPSTEPDDDETGWDPLYKTAYIFDGGAESGAILGFSLYGKDSVAFGSYVNWYDHSFGGTGIDSLRALLETPPVWRDTTGDCGIYCVVYFEDIPAGGVDTVQISFIAATGLEAFIDAAAESRGPDGILENHTEMPDALAIVVYPNPFNGVMSINSALACDIDVFDVSGRLCGTIKNGQRNFTPSADMASGVYLLIPRGKPELCAKAVYLK